MTRSEVRRRYIGRSVLFTDAMGRTQMMRLEYIGKRGISGVGEDGQVIECVPAEAGTVGDTLHFKMAPMTFQKGRHQLRT